MKNTKITKILVMALSLALLICSAIAFAVSAADDDTYAIKSINISHEDSTKVLVAVDALGVDPATIEVKYTIGAGEEKTAKYYGLVDIYKDGNQYPVFYTEGIPAKDMGEDVVAEAHKAGTTPAAPEYKNVSVATYLYTKLYKEGYAAETAGEAAEKRALYESMLEYGANAQEVLWNNKNPGAERTLVTKYIAVYAEDGNINGKGNFVILKTAGTLKVEYAGDKAGFVEGWNVASYKNGKATTATQNNGTTVAIGKSAILTANVIPGQDFEGTYTEAAAGTDANLLTFADGATAGDGKNYAAEADGTKAWASVKTEANGNKYLNLTSAGRGVNSANRGPGLHPVTATLTENANVFIVSFDFMYAAGKYPSGTLQMIFRGTAGGYTQINSEQLFTVGQIAPSPDTWYNVRFEFYNDADVIQIYRDGRHVSTIEGDKKNDGKTIAELGDVKNVDIGTYNASGAIDVSFDNVAAYKTTKTYELYPSAPAVVEDFESDNYVEELVEWEFSTECAAGGTGDHLEEGQENHYGTMTAEKFTFDSGLTINPNVAKNYANVAGSNATIVTDSNGNKYVSIVANPRVCNKDRSHSIKMDIQNTTLQSNVSVFESDINFVGSGITFVVYNLNNKYAQFNSSIGSSGNFSLGGILMGKTDEWISIRVELYKAEKVAQLYVKNADGEYVYAGDMTTGAGDIANIEKELTFVNISTSGAGTLLADNVVFYTTYKTFVDYTAE